MDSINLCPCGVFGLYLKQAVFLSFLYLFLSFLSQAVFVCAVLGRLWASGFFQFTCLSPPPSPACRVFLAAASRSLLSSFHLFFLSVSLPPPHGSSCRLLSPELWCHSGGERADVGVNRSRLRSVRTAQLFPPMAACAMIKTISSCHCLPGGDSGFLVV